MDDDPGAIEQYLSEDDINYWKNQLDIQSISALEEHFDSMEVEVEQRTALSIRHLQSAIDNSKEAKRLEQEFDHHHEYESGALVDLKHQGAVSSSVISSVAFLESTINEFHKNIFDEFNKIEPDDDGERDFQDPTFVDADLSPQTFHLLYGLDEIRGRSFERLPFLDKYQLTLLFADVEMFDTGTQPYQDVATIRKIRNYLVHHKAEWVSVDSTNEEENEHRLGSAVKGKFKTNPLTTPVEPFFPDKALSHGCAEWCIERSLRFTDEFYSRIGGTPIFRSASGINIQNYI